MNASTKSGVALVNIEFTSEVRSWEKRQADGRARVIYLFIQRRFHAPAKTPDRFNVFF